jgi:hypothetical protein
MRALRQPVKRRAGQIQMALVDHRPHLGEEEGHQQAGDMGAVDIGVGHDDDLVIAQVVDVELGAHADAKRLTQIVDFLIGAQLPEAAPSTFRILPRKGSSACVVRSRAILAEPPAESPSTMNSSVPSRFLAEQSTSLPGRRSFCVAVLRAVSFSCLRRRRSSARRTRKSRIAPADFGIRRQPVVEMVAHGAFDQPLGLDRGQPVLGLADEFRLADEAGHQRAAAGQQILAGDLGGLSCC